MRFLVDAQLPAALARWLSAHGHFGEHVGDCGMADATDSVIWNYAQTAGAIIITKDEDFAQRRSVIKTGPAIVWVRIGNVRTGPLIDWFERGFEDLCRAIERGETLIELV